LLVIRQRLKSSNKRRKHQKKYQYKQGEMIRLPPVNSDHFDDALRVAGEGSGSLLVFHQDPVLEAFHDQERHTPSHSGASSALTSADEFDAPEEFYENKETIKRQQSHEAALDQFTGNVRHSGPRYTAEPQNQRMSNSNKSVPTRSGSKPRAKDPDKSGSKHSSHPSLRSCESGSSAGEHSRHSQPTQEDIYINHTAEPSSVNNQDQDIYENTDVQHNTPKKKKKKDKGFRHREPAALPPVPSPRQEVSSIPPPVPNTPRPKLNITPKYPGANGQKPNYKHHSLSRPFEENPYTNARTGDSDDDDIYVNSPIKSGRHRSSGGRGRRGREGTPKRRYETDRSATMWL
jgi:hypothetical protein